MHCSVVVSVTVFTSHTGAGGHGRFESMKRHSGSGPVSPVGGPWSGDRSSIDRRRRGRERKGKCKTETTLALVLDDGFGDAQSGIRCHLNWAEMAGGKSERAELRCAVSRGVVALYDEDRDRGPGSGPRVCVFGKRRGRRTRECFVIWGYMGMRKAVSV